jgi:glycosyltransferase involved in cell wall biosynthesis
VTDLTPVNLYGVTQAGIGNFRQHTLNFAAALSLFRIVNVYIKKENLDDDIYLYVSKFSSLKFFSGIDDYKHGINIYLLANNEPHKEIYRHFLKNNGLVVFHDLSLYWLMNCVHSKKYIYETEFREKQLKNFSALNSMSSQLASMAIHSVYYNRSVCDFMRGAIVHSRHGLYSIKNKINSLKPVALLNLINNKEVYSSICRKVDSINILLCGYMAPYKNIDLFLESILLMKNENFFNSLQITIAGSWDQSYKLKCNEIIEKINGIIKINLVDEYISDANMVEMQKATDIIINLRYPTCGESSGVAAEVIGIDKLMLVTNIGSFRELNGVIKVDLGKSKHDYVINIASSLISAIKRKLTDREFRGNDIILNYGREINAIIDKF